MSYTIAWLEAHHTPPADLREALLSARQTLHELGSVLDCQPDEVVGAVETLQDELKSAREEVEEAEAAQSEAEDRLEEKLQAEADDPPPLADEAAKARIDELEEEVKGLRMALDGIKFALSDALAMSRRFVTIAEGCGVKPSHVRVTYLKGKEAMRRG